MNKLITIIPSEPILINCAQDALLSLCQLQQLSATALTQDLLQQQLEEFKQQASQQSIAQPAIETAHYLLCCALDEAYYFAARNKNYFTVSLLSRFHSDSEGGEKFYDYLEKFLLNPKKNYALLYLCYYCLSLGFKGKYAMLENGTELLLNKRKQVYQLLIKHADTDTPAMESDPVIKKSAQKKNRLLFKVVVGMLIIVGVSYGSFYYILDQQVQTMQQQTNSHLIQEKHS